MLVGVAFVLGCSLLVGPTATALGGHGGAGRPASHNAPTGTLDESLLAAINAVRRSHGLLELALSPALRSAALDHSREMATHGFFAHRSANGSSIEQRITALYSTAGFRRWEVGETLFWSSPNASGGEAVRGWLRSPEHRAIILGSAWRDVGVAAVQVSAAPGAFGNRRVTIITADFGYRDH